MLDFNLLNINVSDFIGSFVLINEYKYQIIDVDDSDSFEIAIILKDLKNKKHKLTIEKITFKFLQDYGETQSYYYNFDGVYDSKILTIKKKI